MPGVRTLVVTWDHLHTIRSVLLRSSDIDFPDSVSV